MHALYCVIRVRVALAHNTHNLLYLPYVLTGVCLFVTQAVEGAEIVFTVVRLEQPVMEEMMARPTEEVAALWQPKWLAMCSWEEGPT